MPQQPPRTFTAGEARLQRGVALRQVGGIALVELLRLVQLGVALRRRVRAQAADPPHPRLAAGDRVLEVRRVGAVDHVVGGRAVGRVVDLLDRAAERLAARQAAVGLERERDHRRQPDRRSRPRDADRLLGVGHRDRGDHVRRRVGERADLDGVVALGLLGGEHRLGGVAVALGADAAADHDRRPALVLGAELLHQRDRLPVERVELLGRVAELGRPARAGPPGRALEHEADARARGRRSRIGRVVEPQRSVPSSSFSRSNAAKSGSSRPWWKISVVSMPPSVRKRPPSSWGRRSRYTSRTYHLGQAPFQERPVAGVHLERERVAVRRGRLVAALEPAEEDRRGRRGAGGSRAARSARSARGRAPGRRPSRRRRRGSARRSATARAAPARRRAPRSAASRSGSSRWSAAIAACSW